MDISDAIGRAGRYLIHNRWRTYRTDVFKKELDVFFRSDEIVTIMPAVRDGPACRGIAKAHQNCVRDAKEKGLEYALVLEDDIRFSVGAREHVEAALGNVPDDWEVLTFGIYTGDVYKVKGFDMWREAKDFSGGHFYVMRNTAFDRFLAFSGKTNFDRWLTTGGVMKAYAIWPMCASQHPGWSDNAKANVNLDALLKKYKYLKWKTI